MEPFAFSEYGTLTSARLIDVQDVETTARLAFAKSNPEQMTALVILETIVANRYGGLSATKAKFMHEKMDEITEEDIPFGDALFDAGLSYCSCLALANYLHSGGV